MAGKGKKTTQVVHLKSTESGYMYHTIKNTKKHRERLELKKYDPTLRRVVVFRETKSK